MDIKVLGSGCATCKQRYEETNKAVQQLGLDATLTKVQDPALVIDGEVRSAGRIPTPAEFATWLTTAALKESEGGA